MPENFGIAEIGLAGILDHGIAFVFGKGESVVGAVGDALDFLLTVLGEDGDQRAFAESGGVVVVNDRAAGEDRAQRIGRKRDGTVVPVDQIRADGVSPVHGSPVAVIGIVLVVEVILAVVPDHAVGIVHPELFGRKMDLRPVLFLAAQLMFRFGRGDRRKEARGANGQRK